MNIYKSLQVLALCSFSVYVAAESDASRDWKNYPDFSNLRQEIGWNDNFTSVCESGRPTGDMNSLMNDGNWSEAVKLGLLWLESCPVDIRVHYYVGFSLSELGREQDAEVHKRWIRGLMDSILSSGDGNTQETAYVTISVNEEYDVLYLFKYKLINQSLLEGKTPLDVLTVEDKAGEEFTIYFNPAAHFTRLGWIN